MNCLLFVLFRAAVFLLGLLPFRVLYWLSNVLFLLMYRLIKYRNKVVAQNLSNSFPQKKQEEILAISKAYYRHLCDLVVETIKGFSLSKQAFQERFKYKNPEIFDPYFEKKQNVLLLGSHYGNWEWGSISFPVAVKHHVVGVYKPLKNKILEIYLNSLRKKFGLRLADMRTAGRAFAAKENQPAIIVLIADQTPSDIKNAHWVNFLHQDTPFLHGADKLARQTGFPVFHFQIQKTARGHYEVTFEEICTEPRKTKPGEITQRYAEHLEKMIQHVPDYWLWSHRRWKRRRL